MDLRPGVTVVITAVPPRVVGGLVGEAVASVAAQTRLPEVIVISIDRLGSGEWETRNAGLAAVTTEWTAFLDDDDLLYPQHLERLLAHTDEADLVYPWFDVENGSDPLGAEGQPFDAERMLNDGNFVPVTYLVRTALARQVGGFPAPFSPDWPFQGCVDWGFHKRLVRAGARYVHVPERTWIWRHGGHEHAAGRPWPEWETAETVPSV